MGYRNYSIANGFIVDKLGNGDFTTISSALVAATAGTTIFIRPGTYTESVTMKAGVNLTACSGDAEQPNVIINGRVTATYTGTATISNIQLQTNTDFLLVMSGSAATVLNIEYCNLNVINATGVSFTNSNNTSSVLFYRCKGNLGGTGIQYFICASPGVLSCYYCYFNNSGGSTTASTTSTNYIVLKHTTFNNSISASGTGLVDIRFSDVAGTNTTGVALAGSSGSLIEQSKISAGSATAITVTSPHTLSIINTTVDCTNTVGISGTGTISYGHLDFINNAATMTVTTQIPYPAYSRGLVVLSSQLASSASTISFTNLSAAYTKYLVILENIIPSGTANFNMVVSTNGGSTYLNSGYQAGSNSTPYNSATVTNNNSTTNCVLGASNTTTGGLNMEIWLDCPTTTHTFTYSMYGFYNGATILWGGGTNSTTNTVNAIQFAGASGTFSGRLTLCAITN